MPYVTKLSTMSLSLFQKKQFIYHKKTNLFITLPTLAAPHGRQLWKRAGSDWTGHHEPLRVTSCSGLETCSRVYEDIPLLRCCLCALTQI